MIKSKLKGLNPQLHVKALIFFQINYTRGWNICGKKTPIIHKIYPSVFNFHFPPQKPDNQNNTMIMVCRIEIMYYCLIVEFFIFLY